MDVTIFYVTYALIFGIGIVLRASRKKVDPKLTHYKSEYMWAKKWHRHVYLAIVGLSFLAFLPIDIAAYGWDGWNTIVGSLFVGTLLTFFGFAVLVNRIKQ